VRVTVMLSNEDIMTSLWKQISHSRSIEPLELL